MLWLQYKNYLFAKDFRITCFVGALIGMGGLIAFCSFMWYLSAIPSNDPHVYGMVAFLFTVLTVWCAYSMFRNLKILNMRYEIVNDVVINYYGKNSIMINLNSDILKVEKTLPLMVGKGKYTIDFLLITNTANKVNSIETKSGLDTLLKLWKQGVVVLPKSVAPSTNK